MSNAYKVRELKKKDQRKLAGMILNMVDRIDDQSIRDIISSVSSERDGEERTDADRKSDTIRVFMQIFKKLAVNLGEEVNAFFADLIGVTPEQYDDLPFDIDVQILEQLKEAPEIDNFFTGLSRLYSGTAWLSRMLRGLKTKSDLIIKSVNES